MTQEQLIKLAGRYDDKASRAYYNYQETGMPRYDRERSNAEDMAEALRMAANAADDHSKLISLRAELADLAYRGEKMLNDEDPNWAGLIREIVSLAEVFAGYKRRNNT